MTTNLFDIKHCEVISENLKVVREELSVAAHASGRDVNEIRLMAVTKTVLPEYINHAINNCGIDLIGENKVQEFLSKKDSLNFYGVEKHLIGHLQTNKVKKIISEVDMIQSVDSVKLAQVISSESEKLGITSKILLELNIGGEESKTGFDKVVFSESLDIISELPNILVKGIMTIPPICDNSFELEKYFDDMRNYYEQIKQKKYKCFDFEILSMGMSGDYKEAVLHGSNLVRIGSAIFGVRNYNK